MRINFLILTKFSIKNNYFSQFSIEAVFKLISENDASLQSVYNEINKLISDEIKKEENSSNAVKELKNDKVSSNISRQKKIIIKRSKF